MQLKQMKVQDNCKLMIHFNLKDPYMEKILLKQKKVIKKNNLKMKTKDNIQIKMKRMLRKRTINRDSLHN